jgi:outer membrane protein assembly factor BamB
VNGSIAVLVAAMLWAPVAFAQDWPQWRGPDRTGTIASFTVPTSWPEGLNAQWKVEVGLGYATPIIVDDRIYVFTRQGENEVMSALDAASGEVIWRTAYAAPFQMNPATARHGAGPKSTPTYADGRLFTLGMSGIVTAFDADSGRQLWQKPPTPVQPMFHTAMSPVVDGDLMILHVGGDNDGALTAFDVATGDVRWSWDGDGPAYGSPLILTLGGTRQVVTFTQRNFVGVSLAAGELLWLRPFETPSQTTAQTPILYNDLVIQTGRANGVTAFRVSENGGTWTTDDVWHTDDVSVHMSDCIVVDGVLYGLSHLNSGQYFGLDLTNGRVLWTSDPRQAEHAAMSRTGNTVFSLEDDAELVVIRHSRTGFEPVQRYDVAEEETWAQPTLSGNRIFVKDVSSLTLWTVN